MSSDPLPPPAEPMTDEPANPSPYGYSALIVAGIGIIATIGMSLMEPG